ncbi:hypothetical protein C2G38_2157228 [Gigaspora rosea]|uniref:Uncharacterized protein n=1 Tax=Gigaspora rosea TaxID=44941 RepID=A0A397W3D7_9GLOM|nr:hypothetical protein C2G38_2157228 [Gigaspora rosea]
MNSAGKRNHSEQQSIPIARGSTAIALLITSCAKTTKKAPKFQIENWSDRPELINFAKDQLMKP